MLVNTNKMISISEANKNFSKVAKIVDEDKSVVIMKNNKPRYVILNFDKFSKEASSEDQSLDKIADKILDDNIKAFKELPDRWIILPTVDYILKLHDGLIKTVRGISGIRNLKLLKSSVENSKAVVYGRNLYSTIESNCANICFNIIKNYAFVYGNKRTGIYVKVVYTIYSRLWLKWTSGIAFRN